MRFRNKTVAPFTPVSAVSADPCSCSVPARLESTDAAQHVWDCAVAVETSYGNRAETIVAQRMQAAQDSGDLEGAALWRRVGETLGELYQIGRNLKLSACEGSPSDGMEFGQSPSLDQPSIE